MSTPWQSPLLALPADADVVWVRRLPWFDKPVLATFNGPAATFTSNTTAVVVPAAGVYSWKPQFPPTIIFLAGAAGNSTTTPIDTTGATLIVVNVTPGALTSDSAGNTWTALSTHGGIQTLYYCLNPITSTTHTFTDSNAASGIAIAAFAGPTTFDSQTGSATGPQPGSLTPAAAFNLLIAADGMNNTGPAAIDLGYSKAGIPGVGGVNYGCYIAWLIQASATARNPTWSPADPCGAAAFH